MDAKSAIIALLFAAMLVCTVAAKPNTGQQDAGSVVTVTTTAPEVESVTVDLDTVILISGIKAKLHVTANVFGPNGIGYLDRVEITGIDPNYADKKYFADSFPLSIKMALRTAHGDTRGEYDAYIEVINMPPGDHTLTVAATDKESNAGWHTAEFTVLPTLAIAVTDVEFGALQPDIMSFIGYNILYIQ